MDMKNILQRLFTCILLSDLYQQVLSQGAGEQARALLRLGTNGNSDFVNNSSCGTVASTTLHCSFVNNKSQLIVADQNGNVSLERLEYQICLCDSAMTVNYYLSDGTPFNRSCEQCPIAVQIDSLTLYHNINVFVNEKNKTVIGVMVWLTLSSGDDILLINGSIPLTEQDNESCPNGTTGPPESCPSPTTVPSQPTSDPTTSAPAPKGNNRIIIAVPIIIVICLLIIIVLILLTIYLCYQYRCWCQSQNNKKRNQSPTGENTVLNEGSRLYKK